MSTYYDSTKLLTLTDLYGRKPEIYMVCGNRTAGKTFNFKRLLLNKFVKRGEKFCWIVRYSYEMENIANAFMADIGPKKFPGKIMTQKPCVKKVYDELFLDGESCGYCVPLNKADTIKKYSAPLSDVSIMYMDEFQAENNTTYCSQEVSKFMGLHTSIARGGESHVRYVPVFMSSNSFSLFNPYFNALGVTRRMQYGAKFIRGDGWILEMNFNEEASNEYLESAFARAFANNGVTRLYNNYQASAEFVRDSKSFIRNVDGPKTCIFRIVYNGINYGLWSSEKHNCYYFSKKFDPGYSAITFSDNDHSEKILYVNRRSPLIKRLLEYFNLGLVYFEDIDCKNMFMEFMNRATN